MLSSVSELPVHRLRVLVLPVEVGGVLAAEFLYRADPPVQAAAHKQPDFDLGHVQTAAVFQGIVELDTFT